MMDTTFRPHGFRLRRIWEMAEYIVTEPGQTRKRLACTYSLSERQVQADLNALRSATGALVRRSGYRFDDADGQVAPYTLVEAATLLLFAIEHDVPTPIQHKLPSLLSPHLHAFARAVLDRTLPLEYVRALVRSMTIDVNNTPLVPQVFLYYRDAWWIVGQHDPSRRCIALPITARRDAEDDDL